MFDLQHDVLSMVSFLSIWIRLLFSYTIPLNKRYMSTEWSSRLIFITLTQRAYPITNSYNLCSSFWVTINEEKRHRSDISGTGIVSRFISPKWTYRHCSSVVGARPWWNCIGHCTPSWISQLSIHSYCRINFWTQFYSTSNTDVRVNHHRRGWITSDTHIFWSWNCMQQGDR